MSLFPVSKRFMWRLVKGSSINARTGSVVDKPPISTSPTLGSRNIAEECLETVSELTRRTAWETLRSRHDVAAAHTNLVAVIICKDMVKTS